MANEAFKRNKFLNQLEILYIKKSKLRHKVLLKKALDKLRVTSILLKSVKKTKKSIDNTHDGSSIRLFMENSTFIQNSKDILLPNTSIIKNNLIKSIEEYHSNKVFFSLIGRNLNDKRYYYLKNDGPRKYYFNYLHSDYGISCFYLNYIKSNTYSVNANNINRTIIKFGLIFALLIIIWYYLLVIIANIYTNYGSSFFKICVMPLISSLIINLLIVSNILIGISSYLMFYLGDILYNNHRFSINRLIFNTLVPISAINYHKSIQIYRKVIKILDK